MALRISPLWWPVLAAASPVLAPLLVKQNRRFTRNKARAEQVNAARLERAGLLDLPALDFLELTVLSEEAAQPGFLGEPGVSYLFRTDQGSLLFDLGFGPDKPTLAHNAARLGFKLREADGLAVSHLHPDHMGGLRASRTRQVKPPPELGSPEGKPCFLPDQAEAPGFTARVVKEPCLLPGGLASTGPLARALFFLGWCEEQALVARLKGKGLVIFTGCGHPTIELILEMAGRLSQEPVYAIGGGLHFPLTKGRGAYPGIQMQMLLGTGKPPWRRLSDRDLSLTIETINRAGPEKVFLSAHDTCDYALGRLEQELRAEIEVLKAGAVYRL